METAKHILKNLSRVSVFWCRITLHLSNELSLHTRTLLRELFPALIPNLREDSYLVSQTSESKEHQLGTSVNFPSTN